MWRACSCGWPSSRRKREGGRGGDFPIIAIQDPGAAPPSKGKHPRDGHIKQHTKNPLPTNCAIFELSLNRHYVGSPGGGEKMSKHSVSRGTRGITRSEHKKASQTGKSPIIVIRRRIRLDLILRAAEGGN